MALYKSVRPSIHKAPNFSLKQLSLSKPTSRPPTSLYCNCKCNGNNKENPSSQEGERKKREREREGGWRPVVAMKKVVAEMQRWVRPRRKGDLRDVLLMSLSFALYVYISQRIVGAYCAWMAILNNF
ncbi:hypothetical protein AMTRI_Chr03g140000 [Amborella trichopoda]|uniref:Transmembrane protein n=1 Tax=Amborella trichopoda TaxID=13333 RepID=W1NYY4_AMBTC|nr:hypothetical protein AMTR_s00103p00105930 [Amborella trichopoda]